MANERLIQKVSPFTAADQEGAIILDGNGLPYTSSNPFPTNQVTSTNIEGKGKNAVGTTAVEVTFTGTPTAIIIKADKDNTGLLFVGKSDVTNLGANAFIPLEAGEAIAVELNDTTNAVYVVSDTAAQNYWAGAVL